jgi:hypothetical protein
VRLPDFAGMTTFRWTLAIAGASVLCTLVFFGFVYWQTAAYMTSTIDGLFTDALRGIAADPPTFEKFTGFVRALAVDAARKIMTERPCKCVPKTLNPTIVVMQSTEDAA